MAVDFDGFVVELLWIWQWVVTVSLLICCGCGCGFWRFCNADDLEEPSHLRLVHVLHSPNSEVLVGCVEDCSN